MPRKRNASGQGGKKAKRQPTGDYPIGNCRPPKKYWFKKGEPSPNPGGRPPGKPKTPLKGLPLNSACADILKMAQDVLKVNGTDTTIIDAAWKKLVRMALVEGREKSLHKLLAMHTAAQQGAFDEKTEMIGYAVQHKEKWGPEFARCEAEGRPVPNILPHPDDIEFDAEGGVVILGAVDADTKKLQDLRESELHKRLKIIAGIRGLFGPNPRCKDTDAQLRRLEREAARLNNLLPPRLQVHQGIKRSEAIAELKNADRLKRAVRPAKRPRRRNGGMWTRRNQIGPPERSSDLHVRCKLLWSSTGTAAPTLQTRSSAAVLMRFVAIPELSARSGSENMA